MALPKKKITRRRRDQRRSHDALTLPSLSECSHCKQPKQPHRVCGHCGYYNGKEVLIIEE